MPSSNKQATFSGKGKAAAFGFIFLLIVLIVTFLYVSKLSAINNAESSQAKLQRFESLALIDHLRQTSDDLTRMARTYVITGEPRYEDYFNMILGIRNGELPRPIDYSDIYWDLVVVTGQKPRADGEPQSLLSLMQAIGFSAEEISLLSRSKKQSDVLAGLEQRAMNAIKGIYLDSSGSFSGRGEPDHELAHQLLYGGDYHAAKRNIMANISQVGTLIDKRTGDSIADLAYKGQELELISTLLGTTGLLIILLSLGIIFLGGRKSQANKNTAGESMGASAPSAWQLVVIGLKQSLPLLVAAVIVLALITGLTWRNMLSLVEQERSDLSSLLSTVLTTTARSVEFWFLEREREAVIWAQSPTLAAALDELSEFAGQPEVLLKSSGQQELASLLTTLIEERTYLGYMLVSSDGAVLASDRDGLVGSTLTHEEDAEFISAALAAPRYATISLPESWDEAADTLADRAIIWAGAKVVGIDANNQGVLIFLIDPELEFTEILQRGRAGVSGESYAFNGEGKLISESRFDDDLRNIGLIDTWQRGILNIDVRDPGGNMVEGFRPPEGAGELPLTVMAGSAISGNKSSNLDGYNDYRGVPVVGAWIWNEQLGYGITTEMDVAEAHITMVNIRRQALITILFSVLLLVLLVALSVWGRVRMAVANARLAENNLDLQRAQQELLNSRSIVEQSEQRISAIVQASPDAIITINQAGIVGMFSHSAEEMFGYRADEIVGQNISLLMPEVYAVRHDELLEKYNPKRKSNVVDKTRELVGQRRDGSAFPIEEKVTRVQVGEEIFFLGLIRDLTERKILEAREQKATLEARLLDRATAVAGGAQTFDQALQSAIDMCCDMIGWPVGHAYVWDSEQQAMVSADVWCMADDSTFSEFREITDVTTFSAGEGLPGRVRESGRSIWIEQLAADRNFPRNKLVTELGLSTGVGFPVTMDG